MTGREPDVIAADNWWDSLSAARKVRVRRWLDKTAKHTPVKELPGQQALDNMPPRPRRRDHHGRFAPG